MDKFDIYKDIAERTGGDIYIGVVGPVRTGKSSFISRFMQEMVIPGIVGGKRDVAVDELPQSASGKTVMTTEPKFVPGEAAAVTIDNITAKVRLIDCVGYVVDGALGVDEDGKERLVKTPWSDDPVPFARAAEVGTQKVIGEHSTIGVVVTTDGSFTEIPRSSYEVAENRVIDELKALKKPFVVLFNTASESAEYIENSKKTLEDKYGVPVICGNVLKMDRSSLNEVIKSVLLQFPLKCFDVCLPDWMQALPPTSSVIGELLSEVKSISENLDTMRSFASVEAAFGGNDNFESDSLVEMDMGKGRAKITVSAKKGLFYKVLSDECGEEVDSDFALMNYVRELAVAKKSYGKLRGALECAESTGYGVVSPAFDETELSEPEVVKRGGGYSVRMKAKAKSLHIIRADLETEVNPVSGSKKQCDDFVEYLKSAEEGSEWDAGVFGKPLREIISDEVSSSGSSLGDNIKFKLRKTLNRAVNEKKNNLFCILI